jgi:hypothetical protein
MTIATAFTSALAEERAQAQAALVSALRRGDEEAGLDALGRLADLGDIARRSLDASFAGLS